MTASDEILKELDALSDNPFPSERRFKVNDASIEKIIELLQDNAPRGLMYHRDELITLFRKMDKVGHEADRGFLIESWNGNGSHTDDRIGRGTTRAENLCLSLLGTIQPGRLVSYLRDALSDDGNDGFPQRLQLAVYPDSPTFKYVDEWPDKDAKNRVYRIVKTLAEEDFLGKDFNHDDISALFKILT
jgi:hypothetical protein